MERATILIIDQIRNHLKLRLTKQTNHVVVGNTDNLDIGFTLAERHQPNVILFNVDLYGDEGFRNAEVLVQEFPTANVILMTRNYNETVLRNALQLGAKDVINLEELDEQLLKVLNRVLQQARKQREIFTVNKKVRPQFKTVTVFSTKGGVGRTTIALNLAIAIRQITRKRVALVDLDLMSGNVSLMAGIISKQSIADLVDEISSLDEELLDNYCFEHTSGLKILPAPLHPETAGYIETGHVEKILDLISQVFHYVIIDTPAYLHDTVIPALEQSRNIIVPTTLDLASIQNLKQGLELLTGLSMESKVRLVVNRMGYTGGLKVRDLEDELGMAVQCIIPDCEKLAIDSVNLGRPYYLSARKSPAAKQLEQLALMIISNDDQMDMADNQGNMAER